MIASIVACWRAATDGRHRENTVGRCGSSHSAGTSSRVGTEIQSFRSVAIEVLRSIRSAIEAGGDARWPQPHVGRERPRPCLVCRASPGN
ncbi:MAG: hypothetical protein AVDCRST_MAG59-3450 [uncultured Thermomicrobiales bacterium]|uniref:Uncharacterized protein n=1 Tax=uncultured Thermomicrobiales bacterium TaxID=1645740 RepID=A0A6J4V9W8_9BACT|nr:MAG: hypothetical protein AVDCRST_MAG59-3450 [uncultured Thermomicrobiales bacterium]